MTSVPMPHQEVEGPHLDGAIEGSAEQFMSAIPKCKGTHCIFMPWESLQGPYKVSEEVVTWVHWLIHGPNQRMILL